MRANAVLGHAVGCELADVAPFVRSLRAVFSGPIVLAVDREPTLLAWLSTHGVETEIAARPSRWRPAPAAGRFEVFGRMLRDRPGLDNVILADVRHVVFQRDPFRDPPEDLRFYRGAGGALGCAAVNGRAIQALVGAALAGDLRDRVPVTADVIAGPGEALMRFCRTLSLLCAAAAPSSRDLGLDRAACHVIAWLGLSGGDVAPGLERVAIVSCGQRVEDALIVNPDDTVSPVVVGYERRPDLARHVQRRWGLPAARGLGSDLRATVRSIRETWFGAAAELR